MTKQDKRSRKGNSSTPVFYAFPDGVYDFECSGCTVLCYRGTARALLGASRDHADHLASCALFPFNDFTPIGDTIAVSPDFTCPLRLILPARPGHVEGTHARLGMAAHEGALFEFEDIRSRLKPARLHPSLRAASVLARETRFREACSQALGVRSFADLLTNESTDPHQLNCVVERAAPVLGLVAPQRPQERDVIDDLLLAISSPLRMKFLQLSSEAILRALALGEMLVRQVASHRGQPLSLRAVYMILSPFMPALRLLARGDESVESATTLSQKVYPYGDPDLVFAGFHALRNMRASMGVLSALEQAIPRSWDQPRRSSFLVGLESCLDATRTRRVAKSHLLHREIGSQSYHWTRAFLAHVPDWRSLSGASQDFWNAALVTASGGPRVLIAGATGGDPSTSPLESALGAALTLRGSDVQFLLCDQALPACSLSHSQIFSDHKEFVRDGPSLRRCPSCWQPAERCFAQLNLPILRFSTFLNDEERLQARDLSRTMSLKEILGFRQDSVAVGEHATSATLKYFTRGQLPDSPDAEPVLRRFFHAALVTQAALTNLIQQHRPEVAVFNHGIYVPLGLIGDICRRENVRVVTWLPGYLPKTALFSHGDTYHKTFLTEPVSVWVDAPWSNQHEQEILSYLQSRGNWPFSDRPPEQDLQEIAREIGIDFAKTTIGLLTNVVWDAQCFYPANAFPNMIEWVLDTVNYFRSRPELQLLIRVHPAEVDPGLFRSNQPIIPEILRAFPQLPENVFIIPPESRISTYVAMSVCNAVLIYATTMGTELAPKGIPVIVGGESWIRNKGFTRDVKDREHYIRLLDELPTTPMSPDLVQRALKYAFHFFFRRMIPMGLWHDSGKLLINKIQELEPGADKGLDLVCDGILKGVPFIYPAELNPSAWRSSAQNRETNST